MKQYFVALLVILVGLTEIQAAELGISELNRIAKEASAKQQQFDVNADIEIGNIKCIDMLDGRVCVGRSVDGIAFTTLARASNLIVLQLAISRASVKERGAIGRALNALFLGLNIPKNKEQNDALFATALTLCVADLAKHGQKLVLARLSFEKTDGGCLIEYEY